MTSHYTHLRNQTLLFFVEKLLEHEHDTTKKSRTLHDLSCQFGSSSFTKEMRAVAGGSQSGLKKFLAEFPSLFTVENDLVSYTDTVVEEKAESGPSAVEYFRERMLQYGIGVWVPVRSLLGHRSQAPSSIRHSCGAQTEEFISFLTANDRVFTLNPDKTSVILTEFDHTAPAPTNRTQTLQLVQFYGDILTARGPMLVEQLFHAGGMSGCGFFKSPGDLSSFFGMYGECFGVTANLVTLSDSYAVGLNYLKNYTPPPPTNSAVTIQITPPTPYHLPAPPPPIKPPSNTLQSRVSSILLKTLNENSTSHKNHAPSTTTPTDLNLLQKTTIISSPRKAQAIIAGLQKEPYIALDLEGVNLGNGQITLINICSHGNVFLFDVLTNGGVVGELRGLLGGTGVVKVLHDCRNDSASLYKEFGILLQNVWDTQVAEGVVSARGGGKNNKNASLNGLATTHSLPTNTFKDKIKSIYRSDPRFWSRRPLTKQMICYAASDVVVLDLLYQKMRPLLQEQDLGYFNELVEERVLAGISPEETRLRAKLRKNERDLIELKDKIESNVACGTVVVLSNRELRLLKHLTLPPAVSATLKTSLKIAKKLEKLERREFEGDNSSSSELTSLEMPPEEPGLNFEKVEELMSGLSELVGGAGGGGNKVDASTQTNSTGDICVLRVLT